MPFNQERRSFPQSRRLHHSAPGFARFRDHYSVPSAISCSNCIVPVMESPFPFFKGEEGQFKPNQGNSRQKEKGFCMPHSSGVKLGQTSIKSAVGVHYAARTCGCFAQPGVKVSQSGSNHLFERWSRSRRDRIIVLHSYILHSAPNRIAPNRTKSHHFSQTAADDPLPNRLLDSPTRQWPTRFLTAMAKVQTIRQSDS